MLKRKKIQRFEVSLDSTDLGRLIQALDANHSSLVLHADAHPHPTAQRNYHAEARDILALANRLRAVREHDRKSKPA